MVVVAAIAVAKEEQYNLLSVSVYSLSSVLIRNKRPLLTFYAIHMNNNKIFARLRIEPGTFDLNCSQYLSNPLMVRFSMIKKLTDFSILYFIFKSIL